MNSQPKQNKHTWRELTEMLEKRKTAERKYRVKVSYTGDPRKDYRMDRGSIMADPQFHG